MAKAFEGLARPATAVAGCRRKFKTRGVRGVMPGARDRASIFLVKLIAGSARQ